MIVLIMSGIPGAGKSTYLREALAGQKAVICSADTYFSRYSADGEYRFDPSKLGEAHGECLKNFIGCIQAHIAGERLDVLVVDNTNLTNEEIAPYYAIAAAYGLPVEMVTLRCSAETAAKRNVHGVGLPGIQAMLRRLDNRLMPVFWAIKHQTIKTG